MIVVHIATKFVIRSRLSRGYHNNYANCHNISSYKNACGYIGQVTLCTQHRRGSCYSQMVDTECLYCMRL